MAIADGGPAGLLPPLASSGAGEWTARRDADIRAVLADPRLTVPPAGPGGPPGTVSWLRTAVSRFANGAEHRDRRVIVEAELGRLDPGALRATAHELALGQLAGAGPPGTRADVMSLLARPVPVAALAALLGLADPLRAAAAVTAVAAGYFPGSDPSREPAADAGTACLLSELWPPGPGRLPRADRAAGLDEATGLDEAVARIAIMVQACDATAGLIGTALHLLQDTPAIGADCPTGVLLARTLRYRPPARRIRRVASAASEIGGHRVGAGEFVVCDIEAAGHDPAAFAWTASPQGGPHLAFGAGLRPCPAPVHALALGAGVIDAVRERCELQPGTPVEYQAAPARMPGRLDVVLR
jgi:cytochrome P450